MTTAMTTTTPQIDDMIGSIRKTGAARAAHFLGNHFDVVCQTFHICGSDDKTSPQD